MGLHWRHHSRFYIVAWENGPYLVRERHWWKDKRIAQFDQSLQLAIWYVQELDPNTAVAIAWYPRGIGSDSRPTPNRESSHRPVGRDCGSHSGYGDRAAVHPEQSERKPPIPVGFTPIGDHASATKLGISLIHHAKPAKQKYIVKGMP